MGIRSLFERIKHMSQWLNWLLEYFHDLNMFFFVKIYCDEDDERIGDFLCTWTYSRSKDPMLEWREKTTRRMFCWSTSIHTATRRYGRLSSWVGVGVEVRKGAWKRQHQMSLFSRSNHSETFMFMFYLALASALIAILSTAWLIRKVFLSICCCPNFLHFFSPPSLSAYHELQFTFHTIKDHWDPLDDSHLLFQFYFQFDLPLCCSLHRYDERLLWGLCPLLILLAPLDISLWGKWDLYDWIFGNFASKQASVSFQLMHHVLTPNWEWLSPVS